MNTIFCNELLLNFYRLPSYLISLIPFISLPTFTPPFLPSLFPTFSPPSFLLFSQYLLLLLFFSSTISPAISPIFILVSIPFPFHFSHLSPFFLPLSLTLISFPSSLDSIIKAGVIKRQKEVEAAARGNHTVVNDPFVR